MSDETGDKARSGEATNDFPEALMFQEHVLAQIAALHRRVDELQERHLMSEAGTIEITEALALLRDDLREFLHATSPWLKTVQEQLDRIESNFSSLMTRIDGILDDMLELRARRSEPDPNDWTN